jgi:hypothetical protein
MIKELPPSEIRKIYTFPEKSGLAFKKHGKSDNIKDYSPYEISCMRYGIYEPTQKLLTDGDIFIDVNSISKVICKLDNVSYLRKPNKSDYETNKHNYIGNIRTFYVKEYLLETKDKFDTFSQFKITRLLANIKAINRGRGNNAKLYSVSNSYKSLQKFGNQTIPKDLFYPIKIYINDLFFQDSYRISNFNLESHINFEEKEY